LTYMPEPPGKPVSRAHQIVEREGLRIWRMRGTEGVNVYDEKLMEELVEAGCTMRPWQPEQATNPARLAWEVMLPSPESPLTVVRNELAEG
jgi:hypothetical protein